MELNEGQFNILLDILYYLRKNGKESSDFYFTYVNGQERFKLYNVDSDKISLELKGISEINCDQLKIKEDIEKNEIDNVVDKIEKFENIDMNEIDKAKEELKEKNKSIEKNFYDQIKRLIFSFQGKEDIDGKDIKSAKCFKIIGNLDSMFNDFNATGDRRLELEVSGFCNITSDIDREKFKIKEGTVKINPNSEINKVPIIKTAKKDKAIKDAERKAERERIKDSGSKEEIEKAFMDEWIDTIFESKQNLLLNIFNNLREHGKIKFREGKEPKIVPGFNDVFDEQLTEECITELLKGYERKYDINQFKVNLKKRFRKEVKRAKIGDILFGKKIEYIDKENEINEIKKLDVSKECKKLMIDNMEDKKISELMKVEKGKELEKKVKEVIREKVEEGLNDEEDEDYKERLKLIEENKEYCEGTYKKLEKLKDFLGMN